MDTLSALLQGVELSGRVTNTATVRAPWGLARGGAGSAIFHLVSEGACWLQTEGQVLELQQGEAVVLPRGSAHALTDHPDTPPGPLRVCCEDGERAVPDVQTQGEGALCTLVCGVARFEGPAAPALLDALPPILTVRPGDSALDRVLALLAAEARSEEPGAAAIVDGLARLLLLYALRQAVQGGTRAGILRALAHPGLRRALRAVHEEPGARWDLPALARAAAMSRTGFATAFHDRVGTTPGAYVRGHRLGLAGQRLRQTDDSVEAIAEALGYASAAAFSRAFKRAQGCSPRDWRAQSA